MSDRYSYRSGFFIRFLAYLVDSLLLGVIYFVMTFFFVLSMFRSFASDLWHFSSGAGALSLDSLPPGIVKLVVLGGLVHIFYFLFEVFFAATFGKMLMRIEIRSANGASASVAVLINRFLIKHSWSLFLFIAFFFNLPFLDTLGWIMSLVIFIGALLILHKRKRALHDLLCGTAVYSRYYFPDKEMPEDRLREIAQEKQNRPRRDPNEVMGRRW